ncbi:hypothetical protein ACLB2K_008798 [Fragaria x ananassa]
MTILIEQPDVNVPQWEEKKVLASENNEEMCDQLVLDGGFVMPEDIADNDGCVKPELLVSNDEFIAPDINAFGQTFREEYRKMDRVEMSIWECCELLNEVVDESDPDLDEPQIEHLLQTAEAIRKDYPNEDWLHLTALIDDLGKVLLLPSFGGLPQWAVVGDTHPLGCAFDESIVHHKVAKENGTTLPEAGLFVIRYHSFYPLHKSGAYKHLMNEEDKENLKWLNIFNKYDLYSKSKVRVDVEKVKPYYLSLIDKYFPAKLRW